MRTPDSPNPSAAGRRRIVCGSLLVVGALLAYANTWSVPFVYDDVLAIPGNPSIRRLWALGNVLWPQIEGGLTVSGRPLLNLSFALNYAISGTSVWSYHLANTLIHAGAALLLYGLTRRTLRRLPRSRAAAAADHLALAIAALWLLHPLQTQAVTYTVQRAESLMGFFYLLTLYAFVRHAEGDSRGPHARVTRRWAVVSAGACALGMATKETMATAPLLILLYDRTFLAGTFAAAWRARWRLHLSLAAAWLLLAGLLLSTGGNRGGTVGLGVGLPLWAYPLTQFEALSRYLALAVWPHPLIFEYGTFWVREPAEALLPAALVLALLAATGVALGRRPAVGFLGAWFFGLLAPTSLAPGTIQMIVEHRMYLPLAAVVAAVVLSLHHVAGRRLLLAAVLAGVAGTLLTLRRNFDYRSPLALWSDTVAKRPLNPRAHEGLAEALAAAGRLDEAVRVRAESVRLLPDESQYHYNLALTLAAAGRTEDAVRQYRLALRLHPNEARTHNNLAILLVQLGRPTEALTHYDEAVRLRPAESLYLYNRGLAHLRTERPAAAAADFEAALRLRPDYADAHFNLAAALVRLGRIPEAVTHYAAARRIKPEDPDYAVGYGQALLATDRPAEALPLFQQGLAAQPTAAEAHYGAASALTALRRFPEAIPHYKAALQANPRHPHAHFKLANTLLDADRVADAIPHYQAALRLAPQDAEAHHNLGIAFARFERYEEARRAFDEALRLRPDYADARRSREQLRQVTGR